jgi:hypothetical protein
MSTNPFIPTTLIGRQRELLQVSKILTEDGDLLLAGVPGSGRRTLIRAAAAQAQAKVIEIDCLRAIDSQRFLRLLAEGITATFHTPSDLAFIQQWSHDLPIVLESTHQGRARLVWHGTAGEEWQLLQTLLRLPQAIAEANNCRVVLVFQNFPHLRSWDRSQIWQTYLQKEIQQQTRVSYALIAPVTESWVHNENLHVVLLGPLANADLEAWLITALASKGLQLAPDRQALNLFLDYVRGHVGDAIALVRRLWLDLRPNLQTDSTSLLPTAEVSAHHVHRAALALAEDLALTFESLILLLPPSQVRVLESLALDPTTSPHSREYIQKHQLSKGGSLQGALASLQQKGLVYGPEYGYRITLPMLTFWLKYRLS